MTTEHYIVILFMIIGVVSLFVIIGTIIFPNKRKQKVDAPAYFVRPTEDNFTIVDSTEDTKAKEKKKWLAEIKKLRYRRLRADLAKDEDLVEELEKEIKRLEKLIY